LKVGAVSEKFYGLEEISIRNLGVIESANIELQPGLNVLTGETGAGKTMVLTALGLILGGKSDADRVRTGSDRAHVSAIFSLDKKATNALGDEVELEDGNLLISRTISPDGKSRINIGGESSTASKASDIGSLLVEVHAQSSTQRLTKPAYVRQILDSFARNEDLSKDVADAYNEHTELSARIKALQSDQSNRSEEIVNIKEFLKAFSAITPKQSDLQEIESELLRLSSVDELQQAVSASLNYLEPEEISVQSALNSSKKSLDHVAGKDPELDLLATQYGDAIFALQEVNSALSRYLSKLDADPTKLEFLQQRKSAINSLIKKYGEGSDREAAFTELIERAALAQGRIEDLQGGDGRIAELESELGKTFKKLKEKANDLSARRVSVAKDLATKITAEIQALSMPSAQLVIDIQSSQGATFSEYSAHGLDEISLLFTSHVGAQPLPLNKVASGGELSRVMLAIEVVLAEATPLRTYIFDEVDAGVGGKAAMEVGRRLSQLADSAQVIVVTHLAQVAVWANNHLVVKKSESGSISNSDVFALTPEERKIEIARMLSGQSESATAQEHAQELLALVQERMIS
jgi:DNA repair protein RecN (Recombination protein N)